VAKRKKALAKIFSVLVSVYSKESPDYLLQSLESVINQTLPPDEIVLVADGPLTSALDNVIERFKTTCPLKVIRLEQNVGLGLALAEGLLVCRNEYVARVDSDDICLTDRFETQIAKLDSQEEVSVVGGFLEEFVDMPGDTGIVKSVPLTSGQIKAYSRKRNPMNHPTVMFRKSHVLKVGSYQHMPFFEDYYLWLRLLSKGYSLVNIPKVLINFRSGRGMIRRRHGLRYAIFELEFLTTCVREGLIKKRSFLAMVVQRFPARIVPKFFLEVVYRFALRRGRQNHLKGR
jgi:glycosyltransferase involved in cell wall biosynthesis